MGFLDKAKAAANELAAKADTALGSAGLGGPSSGGGDSEKYFRDLGVLAYLEASGRPAAPEERLRVTAALQELEARGAIRSFVLQTAPPPPPGAAGSSGYPPPPRAGAAPVPPPPAPAAPQWPAAPTPPPPPPSWLTKDESGDV